MDIHEIRRLSLEYAKGAGIPQKVGSASPPRREKVSHNPTWRQRYRKHLKSSAWKAFRAEILNARGKRCERCGNVEGEMDIHHKTYANLGREKSEDVEVLCEGCHKKLHPNHRGKKFIGWFVNSLKEKTYD